MLADWPALQHSYSLFPLYNLARITDRKLRGACTSGSIDALNAPLPAALCVVDIAAVERAVETDRHRQRRLASLLPPVFLSRRVDGGSCRSTVTSSRLVYIYFNAGWKPLETTDLSRHLYIYISFDFYDFVENALHGINLSPYYREVEI